MTTKRRKFVVTIEGIEDEDAPVINRLRSWLKAGWRQFGLRCVAGHEERIESEEAPGHEQAQIDPDQGQAGQAGMDRPGN